ncbi:MAG: DUF4493 domain-containing protein [Muribaculaceae bacterium]|nr:DUF4493 domain-containing protein [Muribaculaceae bacterium]
MKKYIYSLAVAALAILGSACSDEIRGVDGNGTLALNTSLNSDLRVVSRATEEELAESATIWIANDKGVVRSYNGISEVPASIDLVTGAYKALAWAGDSVSASFDKRCYKGYTEFTINAGATTAVNLDCNIANVVASVTYADNIDDVLTDYTMTVGHSRGSLIFEGRDTRKGYFMMPSYSPDLIYELKGKLIDGSDFSFSGVIEAAQAATEYALTVKYNATENTLGGAIFSIVVDKHEIQVENHINLIPAPTITGYGFDIASAVVGEAGKIGRRSVYISSATRIDAVDITSTLLRNVPIIDGEDCDILSMTAPAIAALKDYGINFSEKYDADEDTHLIQLNFEETLTNTLPNGDYTFEIKATNSRGSSSTATLTISVSDAKVIALPVIASQIGYTEATLRATIVHDNVSTVGFMYRQVGDTQWTEVQATDAVIADGAEYTVTVTGLRVGTQYEYVATADGNATQVTMQFTTNRPELPNAGFEQWCQPGKSYIPAASADDKFWDTGNDGSTTMGANYNITTPESTIKHSGNYSAKLRSQFVGVFTFGKFAAGNIYAGSYLKTDGTNGILGWGRPFDFEYRPTAVRVWVKYTPEKVDSKGVGDGPLKQGDLDSGIIYVAFTDDTDMGADHSQYEDQTWSVVVRTNPSNQNLFSKNDANVVAYGEQVFTAATPGNELKEYIIPINTLKEGATPTRLIFVASASRYGDYFCGGEGSTMYLDDIEFIY